MRLLATTLFSFLLVLIGCTESSDDSTATEETAMSYDASDPAMLRPDAANPVNESMEVPLGWTYRFDNADADVSVGANADSFDVFFATMTPGWHVTTTQASGIFWHPASTADGVYSASAEIHLFAPGQRNEGFGLIFGGQNLDMDDQSYLYFLLRRSGEFLVKKRVGDDTETLAGWEANDAILAYTEETVGTVLNKVAVQVDDSSITFLVNDTAVHSMPKDDLETNGIVGFRLNHGLNVHIQSLQVTESL